MGRTQHQSEDGELIAAHDLPAALTAGTLVYADGASQTFTDGDRRTTYVERGTPTHGTWEIVGDGEFSSFWPPDYRASYIVRWIVRDAVRVGISFTEVRSGSRSDGLYR